jgi:hypothetical protein
MVKMTILKIGLGIEGRYNIYCFLMEQQSFILQFITLNQ